MTKIQQDIDYFDVIIQSGASESLVVDTQNADNILLTIDSGETGVSSERYTVKASVDTDVGFGFQQVEELSVTNTTALSHTNPAYGRFMQFEITNEGGSEARYRAVAESFRLKI